MPGGVGKHFWDESLRTRFGEQGREMGWPPSCLSVPTNARVPHSRVMSSDTAPPPPPPPPKKTSQGCLGTPLVPLHCGLVS